MMFAILSGLLLTVSFPGLSWSFTAWFALVPFLFAIDQCETKRKALLISFVFGVTYFGCSMHWLRHVHVIAWVLAVLFEILFILWFGWFVFAAKTFQNSFLKIVWIALAWMSAEFLRAEIPVMGFGWNLIALSQASHAWILQSANTVGAYGLGFAIAFVNAVFFEMGKSYGLGQKKLKSIDNAILRKEYEFQSLKLQIRYALLLVVTFVLMGAHGYYHLNVKSIDSSVRTSRVSVLQGNIPQKIKWEPAAKPKIVSMYQSLTELASFDLPDVIIFPEAAFPGYFNKDSMAKLIEEVAIKTQKPLVIGSPHHVTQKIAHNSAYLLNEDGEIVNRYDKLNLVPFGEYVPWHSVLGWLEPVAYAMGVSDFTPGLKQVLFKLKNDVQFSMLICFEDLFPNLSRRLVKQGAQFLAVITNDAWFGRTAAAHQHLQASIFRAVENGVSVVRAANTGVSAFISPKGEVLDRVQDVNGNDVFVTGHKTFPIPVEPIPTLYQMGGYLIPYAGLFVFALWAMTRRFLTFI